MSINTPLPEIEWIPPPPWLRQKIFTSALRVVVLSASALIVGVGGGVGRDFCVGVVEATETAFLVIVFGFDFGGVEVPITLCEELVAVVVWTGGGVVAIIF